MFSPNLDIVTVIEAKPSYWPLTPKQFWRWREAFYHLIFKEFQVRFQGTYLGIFWVILQPVIGMCIFLVAFHGNTSLGPSNLPYSVYILSGLIFWTFISNGFVQASQSLLENRPLIVQTSLKRALIPLSILTSKLIDLGIGIIFLLIWVFFDPRVSIHEGIFLLPLDVFGMFLALVGITFIFSSLCIQFKDIRYIIPFLAQSLFFATPVFYAIPESPHAWLIYLNPLTVFILAVRDHIFGTKFVTTYEYVMTFVLCFAVFTVGGLIFRKFERTFADLI